MSAALERVSQNTARWRKRRKRPGRAALMLAALLASTSNVADANFGQNKCSGSWTRHGDCTRSDCLIAEGSIPTNDGGTINHEASCTCQYDYIYEAVDGTDPIQTLAILSDWRDSYTESNYMDAVLKY